MLDPRIYRAGWAPALLALIVCAFSLETPPGPVSSTLAPDAFIGQRAFAAPGTGLRALAAEFPRRPPGSAADEALAGRVQTTFRQSGLNVQAPRFRAETVLGERRLQSVIGVRAGLSSRRVVVLAHRDALASPATADLSGTAALIELARVFRGRSLGKTLVLVSTSGGSGGAAGAARFARDPQGPVDAVLVLGDLAGPRVRRPLVVPWSNGLEIAPLDLRRTVAGALLLETGLRTREPRFAAQFARLAFPLTPGEQGELAPRGLAAVLIGVSGERGPGNETVVSQMRLQQFGRAVLRTITALDARPAGLEPPRPALSVQRKLVPQWAVRVLVAMLILPALLAAVDGFARVRRRRHPVGMWMGWTLAGALPFVAALALALALGLTGLLPAAPPAPVRSGAIPLDASGAAAMASLALAIVVGWLALRPLVLKAVGVRGDASSPGAAAAVALLAGGAVTAVWVVNPFAAALLVPALHVALLVVVPEVRFRGSVAGVMIVLALAPVLLVVLYYSQQLGLGPAEVPWTALLLVVGGHVGLLGALTWCVLLGCLAGVVAIVAAKARRPEPDAEAKTRGPISYAGPGSLGGTGSALRR